MNLGVKIIPALIEALSYHFGVKKSGIRIVKGKKSRNNVVEAAE